MLYVTSVTIPTSLIMIVIEDVVLGNRRTDQQTDVHSKKIGTTLLIISPYSKWYLDFYIRAKGAAIYYQTCIILLFDPPDSFSGDEYLGSTLNFYHYFKVILVLINYYLLLFCLIHFVAKDKLYRCKDIPNTSSASWKFIKSSEVEN